MKLQHRGTCILRAAMGKRECLSCTRRGAMSYIQCLMLLDGRLKTGIQHLFLPLCKLSMSALRKFWKSLLKVDKVKRVEGSFCEM